MALRNFAPLAIFLTLNLLSFTLTTACDGGCPIPKPPSGGSSAGNCPRDALKIAACLKVLNLVDLTVGKPPVQPCCSLIEGLADLEAAICLCTTIKADILGINLNVPIDISLLLNVCSKKAPANFQCV